MRQVFKNVSLTAVFNGLSPTNTYLFILHYKKDKASYLSDKVEFMIQGTNVAEKILNVLDGKTDVEYASYGMTNIDIRKLPKGKLCFMHSPTDAIHDYYELDSYSCKKLRTIFEKELSSLSETV